MVLPPCRATQQGRPSPTKGFLLRSELFMEREGPALRRPMPAPCSQYHQVLHVAATSGLESPDSLSWLGSISLWGPRSRAASSRKPALSLKPHELTVLHAALQLVATSPITPGGAIVCLFICESPEEGVCHILCSISSVQQHAVCKGGINGAC